MAGQHWYQISTSEKDFCASVVTAFNCMLKRTARGCECDFCNDGSNDWVLSLRIRSKFLLHKQTKYDYGQHPMSLHPFHFVHVCHSIKNKQV